MKTLSNKVKFERKLDVMGKIIARCNSISDKIENLKARLQEYKAKYKKTTKEAEALRKLVEAEDNVVSIKKGRSKKVAAS